MGDEELGQSQFAEVLQPIMQELADTLAEKPVVVTQSIKVVNGSKLRKVKLVHLCFTYINPLLDILMKCSVWRAAVILLMMCGNLPQNLHYCLQCFLCSQSILHVDNKFLSLLVVQVIWN